jgi:hypothetical protein
MEGQHGYEFDDYNVNVLATFAATEAKAAADSLVFFFNTLVVVLHACSFLMIVLAVSHALAL